MGPLIQIKNLKKYYPVYSPIGRVKISVCKAVDDVSLDISQGEILGLVGESGCGKTTLAKLLLRLIEPTEGSVNFFGNDIYKIRPSQLRHLRKQMQIIFQDPYNSLDPAMRVFDIITEPLQAHERLSHRQKLSIANGLLRLVGLSGNLADKYPHQFSGGQRQRLCIARALSTNPKFIICDEPVSSLDVSIQAQIINLLRQINETSNITYLFITHDLRLVEFISSRVAVMYMGHIVELASSRQIYREPLHPYTRLLISSIEFNGRGLGQDTLDEPCIGCSFAPRCAYKIDACNSTKPQLKEVAPGHYARCHLIK